MPTTCIHMHLFLVHVLSIQISVTPLTWKIKLILELIRNMTIDNFASKIAEQMKEAIHAAFSTGFQYAQSLNLNDEEFVDLGLPSGTK